MNDERLERELKGALLMDDPGQAPIELRAAVAAIPDARRDERAPSRRLATLRSAAAAAAAVAVIAATLGFGLWLRGGAAGPRAATPSATAPRETSGATPGPSQNAGRSSPIASEATPVDSAAFWTAFQWSPRSSLADAVSVNSVVRWKDGLLAIGTNTSGTVATWSSADGLDWKSYPGGNRADAFKAANVSDLVVTPSGSLIVYGTVGQSLCNGQGEGVTCSPLPVGIWTSGDAMTWTQVQTTLFDGAVIRSMSAGANGVIAVGDYGWNKPAIWTSSDGATWTRLDLATGPFSDAHLSTVRATAAGYLLGGTTGGVAPVSGGVQPATTTAVAAAWWSNDGRSWQKAEVNVAEGLEIEAFHAGDLGLLAIGSSVTTKAWTAWSSADGRVWQPLAGSQGTDAGVAHEIPPSYMVFDDGSRMVAFDGGPNDVLRAWTSPDGKSWQQVTFGGAISGGTIDLPAWGADPSKTTVSNALVLPDGLLVLGSAPGSQPGVPVWRVTAH